MDSLQCAFFFFAGVPRIAPVISDSSCQDSLEGKDHSPLTFWQCSLFCSLRGFWSSLRLRHISDTWWARISSRIPQVLLYKGDFQSSPRLYGYGELSFPTCRTWHFPSFAGILVHFSHSVNSSTPILSASQDSQICIICKLAESALCASIQDINGNLTQAWLDYQPLRRPRVTILHGTPYCWPQHLRPGSLVNFSVHLSVHLLTFSSQMRISWEMWFKVRSK